MTASPRPIMFYVQLGIILIYYVAALLFLVTEYLSPHLSHTQRIGFGLLLIAYASFRSVMFYQKYLSRNRFK
ncbi:MAG: hypothetical protein ACK45G_12465 [Bacteroidota bacterium]